ncbi:helix-turn-helix transcriptional regulator [Bacillus sp. EAC]|uniref:helix-turn-helix domain-containing protein n=1 Tax=Bacillus sp. EAC TaxID=1978338 RepID=UPI000B42EAF3|nr:helix-turn-helix transcriptional regulator [Bacillus sp. EAC]
MNQILLYEFQNLLINKSWNKADLAKHSGIHFSDISRIFNNKKPLSLHYLDAITKAFCLPEGTFYSYYTQLCFNQNRYLDKRRSVAFIYKCAINGYKNELHFMISVMLEEKSKTIRTKNLQNLFQIAEQLFTEGKESEAVPLYDIIINNMPDSLSEEVAISYFRKYYLNRLTEDGPSTLVHVLDYLSYMPEEFQELTFLWIMATYYMLKQWDKVLHYANRLEKIAKIEDHYGKALLYQGFALTRLGSSLDEVLDLINRYGKINEYFAEIAIGNRFVALIDFGQLHYADEYYNWLKTRDDVHVGLPRILESYVKLGRIENAKELIKHHEKEINEMAISSNLFTQQLYFDYCFALSLLKCEERSFIEGLNDLIEVANKVKNVGIFEKFKQCLLAIWHYKEYLTPELEEKYLHLLRPNKIPHFNF